jgi:hypothetical protein
MKVKFVKAKFFPEAIPKEGRSFLGHAIGGWSLS